LTGISGLSSPIIKAKLSDTLWHPLSDEGERKKEKCERGKGKGERGNPPTDLSSLSGTGLGGRLGKKT